MLIDTLTKMLRRQWGSLIGRSLAAMLMIVLCMTLSCRKSLSAPTWTFLMYMDGDNNLKIAALADLIEAAQAGSTDHVNIIVQFDQSGGITTKRYHVVRGGWELLADLGELDMASPRTITDFLVWAKENYPADRTVLVLWNHGNGWDQGDGPSQAAPAVVTRSLLYDDDNGSKFLPNHKVKQAVQAAGIKLDMLGLDASIMGTIEALYEFKDLAPVIVSSQEVGESHGWDYAAVLGALVSNPGMSVEDLAGTIVAAYRNYFENVLYPQDPNYDRRHTIAAFRTACLEPIVQAVNSLALDMTAGLNDPAKQAATITDIQTARTSVQEIDRYIQPGVYADLADLERLLNRGTAIGPLVSGGTIAEYHGDARPNAHGMSIVFFRSRSITAYDVNYQNYDPVTNRGNGGDFINQFSWDEFLAAYYTAAGL